jgi:hypothetical protein
MRSMIATRWPWCSFRCTDMEEFGRRFSSGFLVLTVLRGGRLRGRPAIAAPAPSDGIATAGIGVRLAQASPAKFVMRARTDLMARVNSTAGTRATVRAIARAGKTILQRVRGTLGRRWPT